MRFAATVLLVVAFGLAAVVISGQTDNWVRLANVVGMGAYVAPNENNTLTAELTQWQGELETREKELSEREEAQQEFSQELMSILAVAVGVIAALLGLNYYLDWRRSRGRSGQT